MQLFPLRLIPDTTKINFIKYRYINYFVSAFIVISTILLLLTKGLNLGIDFAGGIIIEAKISDKDFSVGNLRENLSDLNVKDVSIYNSSSPQDVVINVGATEKEGNQQKIVADIKQMMLEKYKNVDFRKIDYVGPKVGSELIKNGFIATIMAFIGILIYLWNRFDLEYSIGAILGLIHDAIATMGFYSLTGLEFNLTSIAAILTIIGYSVNDAVVIYDRIRDNKHKYFKTPFPEIINRSINDTLSRTTLTVATTLLANLSLILFGGEVVKSFSFAMFFGILIGTYSSIFISAPVLLNLRFTKAQTVNS
ncbi:MAG: protein translocase subunit SecF [Sphingobacteriia bacterium]|nr:protein translocase subunit SecF [Sphingobacteriia bacterium]